MLNVEPSGFLNRFVAVLAGLAMISLGGVALIKKDLFYTNWFGELVFAPIAVIFGLFTIWCALFKPDWLARKSVANRGKGR